MITIILDTETTGLLQPSVASYDRQPHIIEIGAVQVVNDKIKKKMSQLLDPGITIPEEVIKITGITNEDVKGKPTFKEFLPNIIKFFKKSELLVCHNAPFDSGVLNIELARVACENFPMPEHVICTVQEYRSTLGKWPKLTELYEHILGKELKQKHRAVDDCIALFEILEREKFFQQMKEIVQ